ncbi:hypothetical protein Tco_0715699 [Tanacetum coccineum]
MSVNLDKLLALSRMEFYSPACFVVTFAMLARIDRDVTILEEVVELEAWLVTNVSETLLISFYISGLKPSIQCELLVAKPATLGEAFFLARVTESRLEDKWSPAITPLTSVATRGGSQKQASSRSLVAGSNSSKPALLPTPTMVTTQPTSKPLAIKWISPAE